MRYYDPDTHTFFEGVSIWNGRDSLTSAEGWQQRFTPTTNPGGRADKSLPSRSEMQGKANADAWRSLPDKPSPKAVCRCGNKKSTRAKVCVPCRGVLALRCACGTPKATDSSTCDACRRQRHPRRLRTPCRGCGKRMMAHLMTAASRLCRVCQPQHGGRKKAA